MHSKVCTLYFPDNSLSHHLIKTIYIISRMIGLFSNGKMSQSSQTFRQNIFHIADFSPRDVSHQTGDRALTCDTNKISQC